MSKQLTEAKLVKTLKISDDTHSRLAKLGSVGQTFEDVIKSLLDEHDDIVALDIDISKKWTSNSESK